MSEMGAALCRREKVVDETAKVNNKVIEKELKNERIQERRTIKVLLLGSADSGKSTIAKQMRILNAEGFTEGELMSYRYMIYSNLVVSYYHMCLGCKQHNVRILASETDLVHQFANNHIKILSLHDEDIVANLQKMRNSEFTKEGLKYVDKITLPDNSAYLFANAHRILAKNYNPTEMDIIHARAATTGVYETGFLFRKFFVRLIDVGGQKTERRKWIHCFENVTAVLFVSALSCYDQFLEECPEKNCLEDSVELFNSMYNNEYLRRCNFILFLNKKDILEKKVEHSPFRNFHQNYSGHNNYEEVREYIKDLFMEIVLPLSAQAKNTVKGNFRHTRLTKKIQAEVDNARHIYLHYTNATDRGNIEFVFGAAYDIILHSNLNRAGMT